MTTNNLTEQWKKGELKDGDYYVKTRQGIIIIDYFDVDEFSYDTNHYVEEVLAPVPSYEEWRNLQNSWVDELDKATRFKKALNDVCDEYNQRLPILEAENTKLKELLEKASYYLIRYKNNDTLPERAFYEEEVSEFLDKIDEVLNVPNK